MTIKTDMAADLAANHYDVDENPYSYAATFYPLTGAPVSLTVNVITEDNIELSGYTAEVQEDETVVEYLRADINRDVVSGEWFTIASLGQVLTVKNIKERDRFSIQAVVNAS